MPARVKTSTTQLPQALVEQLKNEAGNEHSYTRTSRKPKISRKNARKLERVNKKQRKAVYFSVSDTSSKRPAEDEHTDSPQRKRVKVDNSTNSARKTPTLAQQPSSTPLPSKKEKKVDRSSAGSSSKSAAKPTDRSTKPVKIAAPPRSRQEEEEEAYIAYLESKLRPGKGPSKFDDGLDDLFEFTNSLQLGPDAAHDKHSLEGDQSNLDEEDTDSEMSVNDDEAGEEEEIEDEEWHGFGETASESDGSPELHQPEPAPANSQPATKYIPPHLRKAQKDAPSEDQIKLTKQLKGLLNRMSEQNLGTILDSIEEIYRNNRRNDVTSTLTDLIITGIASHSSLLDSFVVLHATLVAALHKIVGIEFAAFFVQNVISLYEQHNSKWTEQSAAASQSQNNEDAEAKDGKECQNLIVLVSELYNFQVISCILVYDLIRSLLRNEITELNVELLLKLARNSGSQLRQDDPSALKDIVDIVNAKIASKGDLMSSRAKFMVETLGNLKNNKNKRNVSQNQGGEAVERMKKFLSGLGKKRHVMAHEPLRVSLEDLHSAESKGKWWLVGASWRGDPLVDQQQQLPAATSQQSPVAADPLDDNALLKLARKQGMNTDIRRSIFVVLMSSDDYVDACERLSQLNLTEVQQREIIRVLLHCCGNEKTYNPYYTLIGQQLCKTSHSFKITIQFCLWDFLRDLGETNVGGAEVIKNAKDDLVEGFGLKKISPTRLRNVAKAYAWWIAKDAVTLAVLKPVDFTLLKQPGMEFLKELFTRLFISSQTSAPLLADNPSDLPTTRNRGALEEIFIKGSRIEALAMGIIYFMSEAFRDLERGEPSQLAKLIGWATGVAKDTLRTGLDVVGNL
ncbi:hypothetical protein HGRIS_003874 [Hohenbuehelia grisea]|uniref:MI domain-containing protein n=1 Tax=Hohenbuehelia grisea TaxID=104357 RepID=A0ABR3JID4_9AGAR